MLLAALCLLVLLLAAVLLERGVLPRGAGWRRPPLAWAALFSLCLSGYGTFLALTGRPLLTLVVALAGAGALRWISDAKYRLLREPLVFSDFALLPQVLRHPRLYYAELLRSRRGLLGGAGLLIGLGLWLYFEPAVVHRDPLLLLLVVALTLLPPALALLPPTRAPLQEAAAALLPAPDPLRDLQRLGLGASLVLYTLRWASTRGRAPEPVEAAAAASTAGSAPAVVGRAAGEPVAAPLVVVIQSESFQDLRRAAGSGPALPAFDAAKARALAQGPLRAPALGAYTMRTEYAFLSGVETPAMGFDGFDPYLRADRWPPHGLASDFDRAGYRTVFVHPHDRSFFRRDRVIPALGFRELVTAEAFQAAARVGPYICDAALGEVVLGLLQARPEPCFLFAVTMENHGPWRPGRLPDLQQETEIYAAHLRNADLMLGCMIEGLEALGRPWLLCFYGDHAPVLPSLPRAGDDARSDYLLLSSQGGPPGAAPSQEELTAAALSARLRALALGEIAIR